MSWEEAEDRAREWQERAEELEAAIDDLLLWALGGKGYAAAIRRLRAVRDRK